MVRVLRKIAVFLERLIERLSRYMGFMAIACLSIMMVFTVLDIILRATISKPIQGDVEIIEMMMIGAGFLGLAWCATLNMHIKVDLLVSRLTSRSRQILDVFNYIIALFLCSVFAWRSYDEGFFIKDMDKMTELLEVHVYPFYWLIAFSYVVLCLVIITKLIRTIIGGEQK